MAKIMKKENTIKVIKKFEIMYLMLKCPKSWWKLAVWLWKKKPKDFEFSPKTTQRALTLSKYLNIMIMQNLIGLFQSILI